MGEMRSGIKFACFHVSSQNMFSASCHFYYCYWCCMLNGKQLNGWQYINFYGLILFYFGFLEPEQVIKIGEVLRKGWGRLGYQIFKVTKLYN
jgi:hypothetical protein